MFRKPPNIGVLRAWLLTLFGCAAIVRGLFRSDPTVLMLGFAVLGGEPIYQAAKNGA